MCKAKAAWGCPARPLFVLCLFSLLLFPTLSGEGAVVDVAALGGAGACFASQSAQRYGCLVEFAERRIERVEQYRTRVAGDFFGCRSAIPGLGLEALLKNRW